MGSPKMTPGALSDRVRAARQMAGISARDLSALAGLSPVHVSMIETGKRPRLEVDTVRDLAEALGVTTDWLILGVGEPPDEARVVEAIARARARMGSKIAATG